MSVQAPAAALLTESAADLSSLAEVVSQCAYPRLGTEDA